MLGAVMQWVLLGNAPSLLGAEFTGTLYSDHSGPSGDGVGMAQLFTRRGLVDIHYGKPIKNDFPNHTCWEIGAIWTVQTKRALGVNELVKAHCVGKADPDVRAAWIAVRRFIESAAKAAGQQLGYQPGRRGPIYVQLGQVKTDISGYLNFGSTGMCLEMKQRMDKSTIVIESSLECGFFPNLAFRVKLTQPTLWEVASVETISSTN
jgi:hypothetical protein